MKQVPKWVVFLLAIVYIVVLFFQMNIAIEYLSGRAATATTTLYVVSGDNSAPYLNMSYPNLTWYRYSSYVGPSLNAPYFLDPDNDTLTFSVYGNSNIIITFNQTTGVPTFSPTTGWWGVEYVYFNATDPGGLTNISNMVVLNVSYREPPPQEQPTGDSSRTGQFPQCIEKWICTPWSECIDGWQYRKCRELNRCGTNLSMPETKRECHVNSCNDGIKNCHDGGCEEDVDCGGPCPRCGTCYDKLKNCHDGKCEEGIDCGGPCLPCVITEAKQVIFRRAPWIVLGIMLIAIFLIEAYIYYIKHYKIYRRM